MSVLLISDPRKKGKESGTGDRQGGTSEADRTHKVHRLRQKPTLAVSDLGNKEFTFHVIIWELVKTVSQVGA